MMRIVHYAKISTNEAVHIKVVGANAKLRKENNTAAEPKNRTFPLQHKANRYKEATVQTGRRDSELVSEGTDA